MLFCTITDKVIRQQQSLPHKSSQNRDKNEKKTESKQRNYKNQSMKLQQNIQFTLQLERAM